MEWVYVQMGLRPANERRRYFVTERKPRINPDIYIYIILHIKLPRIFISNSQFSSQHFSRVYSIDVSHCCYQVISLLHDLPPLVVSQIYWLIFMVGLGLTRIVCKMKEHTKFRAWISKNIHNYLWSEITHPVLNLNSGWAKSPLNLVHW